MTNMFDAQKGSRSWIAGPFICLWFNALDNHGLMFFDLVVREQCVFAVRDEVIFAGLHGCRLRPLQVVIGTRCAIV